MVAEPRRVPWSGVTTDHSTSLFTKEMYEKIKDSLTEYEVAIANVEMATIKALEKQYNNILTPLKDSIPKRLNMHVQKLTRRQSTTPYSVRNQETAPLEPADRGNITDTLITKYKNYLQATIKEKLASNVRLAYHVE
ncbi:hypothetical protein ACFE04_018988 [Oxalis oulophora]